VPPSTDGVQSSLLVKDGAPGKTVKVPVTSRTSPFKLKDLFKGLSDAQKDAFRRTPLGHLLDIQISTLPLNYSHYAIQNYNPSTQDITLADGKKLPITQKSVELVLGFARGSRSMLKLPENAEAMINTWRKQFKGGKRTMKALKELIFAGGIGADFMRNMYVYIICGLIWSAGGDVVYDGAVPYLQEVDDVGELNWCEYVIHKLTEARGKWTYGTPFCGPILFLLVSILAFSSTVFCVL